MIIFVNLSAFCWHAIPAKFSMLVAMLMGLPLPLRAIQILWINLVTDGLPAMALGVEPVEKGVMERPPRSPQEGIFSQGL